MASQCTSFSKILAMVAMIWLTLMFSAASADCRSALPDLVAQCGQFVKREGPKMPPSAGCCSLLKTADVPCLCGLVTPEIEKLLSMEKVVDVARTCGVTVQPGMKCGSYTVPPQ